MVRPCERYIPVVVFFVALRLMVMATFPADNLTLYGDYIYYYDLATYSDQGALPFIHYWSEYPPIFPFLSVGVYKLAHTLGEGYHVYVHLMGLLMLAFNTGNLVLFLRLARRLRLVGLSGRQLRLHRPATREWLQADPPHQMLALQEAWRDDPGWNDLWHVPSLRLERTGWRNDPLATRACLLEHVARCPPGEWIGLESFTVAVKQLDPDFQRPPDAYNTWYIRDAASGEYLMGYEHWDRVEGALITYLISGPLHWLGVTALGFEAREGTPTAFRLTPGGAFFLGLVDKAPEAPKLPPIAVDADLTVRALAGGNLYDRFQLARIAEWQASGEVFVYRITRTSLSRTLSQGIRLDQVSAFLKRVTGDQLPPKAVETLRGWAGRFAEVRLIRAAVLETRTAAIMRDLRAHPEIGPLLGEPLSPTRTLVAERNWRQIVAQLQQEDYLPGREGKKRQ